MISDKKVLLVSIISHNHNTFLSNILGDLERLNRDQTIDLQVILTINTPEEDVDVSQFTNMQVTLIENPTPKGFGANNNQAFKAKKSDFFLVLNPDARITKMDFEYLMSLMDANKDIGILGVQVLDSFGNVEDSYREYPSLANVLKRMHNKLRGVRPEKSSLGFKNGIIKVDWVAGMFMFFVSDRFSEISGFDEKYFMYLEDADICRRMNIAGWGVGYTKDYEITHDAQRASFKNIKHFKWHLFSMIRFLLSKW